MDVQGLEGWTEGTLTADAGTLRRRAPLTHCLTNVVSMPLVANALLAVGASPAMVLAREEAGEFAAAADGLLVNVGTLTVEVAGAMRAAVEAADDAATPWVLDPVGVGPLAFRTDVCRALLKRRPAVIRGNASEILALAGGAAGGRGVDAIARAEDAVDAARELAQTTGAVVAVSGAVDQIIDEDRLVRVDGGDALLTRVTATGCALGALVAAFLAAGHEPRRAAVDGSAAMAAAAEEAAPGATGPGTFAAALLDALAEIAP